MRPVTDWKRQKVARRRRRGLVGCLLAPARLNWYRALRSRHGARYVAGGLSLGVFWAFIPLFILHFPVAIVSAYLLGVSRLAAVAGVLVANPVTVVPLFIVARLTGLALLPGGEGTPQPLPQALTGRELMLYLESLGWYDLWTILLGGGVLGFFAGALTYKVGLRWALDYADKRRAWRRKAGPAEGANTEDIRDGQ